MNAGAPHNADDEEKPLDPATERVRRKLVRFSAVFMGFNILALMAVLAALVYKLGGYDQPAASDAQAVSASELPGGGFEQRVDLPEGAQIVSASAEGGMVLLTLRLSDGSQEVWFYDTGAARITGRLIAE